MRLFLLFALIQWSSAACNSTALRLEILQNCNNADISRPCPSLCQSAVQKATACPADQGLKAALHTYSFCKAQKCKLILKQQTCTGSCQWCNNKCQPSTTKCQQSLSQQPSCEDDPQGLVRAQGLTCGTILAQAAGDCDRDLSILDPSIPQGLTPGQLCPNSCSRCSSAPACADDPLGMVAKFGFNCEAVLGIAGNDCDMDLSPFHPDIPKGLSPGQLCPKSCARCKDPIEAPRPVPQKTTETFVNGHAITSAGREIMQALGVQLPPGRYSMLPDGSVGLEGGPVLANVYVLAAQRADAFVSQIMRETEAASNQIVDQTRTGLNIAGQFLANVVPNILRG